ncbi:PREDICTED: uncharacterized protein LOC104820525 isoform X1 [Tarenaya hassleriana]|uniref:uncharacterized protein LOC104820525 isoform X2 n=1 Tax=Tarenaya hassleriana TaxID=28532 RepID=UPI00053C67F4|nr:PREDICTED: uncharacterized protein LOC104820525 isoform X2 [Tarenaya hassleriana]XP_019058889.1 PREDICTED: uncharacterized protein LOC104820525 isoform X1 [Tarenaya hassleriana]
MSASYRAAGWFPSTGSRQGLTMLEMDKKLENIPTDHSVLHDQDVVSNHSLCSNTGSPNFRAKPFYNGGYNHAADTPPIYHSQADIVGVEKVPHGNNNERFHYGYGLSSSVFKASAATTIRSSLQPYGELSADDARHLPAVDLSSYPHPIAENFHVSQAKLPMNSDRFATERSFGLTEDMISSLDSSGLSKKFHREPWRLGLSPNGVEEIGVSRLDYSLKPFCGESSYLPTEMTRDFEMGSRLTVPSFSYREHTCNRRRKGSFSASASGSRLDNDYNWTVLDEARQVGSYNDVLYRCTATVDFLTERNRGPRASKLKGKNSIITHDHVDHLNQHNCTDAKFFVIKSYSEDNVHKSIKYGVWASTTNGNKKLDAAYREAKEKEGACTIFLLFSVNASAQFCGVAEMVGPVDFDTSVEYWQQDRWTGHFPVMWLIIKDVPNSLFRHIILENNDNKPVTNSRDTQEVGLEQGIEMLSIFKNYEMHSSILDDFSFYEERQKAMQNRKARRRAVLEASNVPETAAPTVPCDLIKNMSNSFAEALVLNRNS